MSITINNKMFSKELVIKARTILPNFDQKPNKDKLEALEAATVVAAAEAKKSEEVSSGSSHADDSSGSTPESKTWIDDFGSFDDVNAIEKDCSYIGFDMTKAMAKLMSQVNDPKSFYDDIKFMLIFLFTRGTNLKKLKDKGTIKIGQVQRMENLMNKYSIKHYATQAGNDAMTLTRLQAAFPFICHQVLRNMQDPPSDHGTGLPVGFRFSAASALMNDIVGAQSAFFGRFMKWNEAHARMLNPNKTIDVKLLTGYAVTNFRKSPVPWRLRDPTNANYIKSFDPP